MRPLPSPALRSAAAPGRPSRPGRCRAARPGWFLLPGFLLLASLLLAACGGGGGDDASRTGFVLPPAPEPGAVVPRAESARTLHARGARSGGADEWSRVEAGHETRTALLTTSGGWSWEGEVPPAGELRLGVAAVADAWHHADRLTVRVRVTPSGGGSEVVEQVTVEDSRPDGGPGSSGGASGGGSGGGSGGDVFTPPWRDLVVDLGRFAGQRVTVELLPRFDELPPELRDDPVVAWSPARLQPAPGSEPGLRARRRDPRPNVLVVVVDTLRADHLGAYGYGRATTPEIDRLLARRGVVFEQAEAQAPWTLPSVLSYLTGRHPSELVADETVEYAIPPDVPSLAERFRHLGYRTAGFFANPTLHAGNGFARGFEVFFTPEPTVRSLDLPGEETVTSRAVPWMLAHAGEPFFAYLHYLDPHDPYLSPLLEDGRTAFDPDYDGPVEGDWVHGLYTGLVELEDRQRDLEHLVALYDEEIRYADRQVGHVLESLPPEVLENTLVVLTSDHGEEFLDHGWWKHGQTVYQEQLHVPLVMRWDGRLPAGERVAAPVQLLDLVPTLLAAATGGEAGQGAVGEEQLAAALAGRDAWDGVDLLPVAAGDAQPPRRASVADHLGGGPRRASVRLGDWKLVMFDRVQRYEPTGVVEQNLHRVALDRLRRVELYDLARDPEEGEDVSAAHPDVVERLAPLVVRQLDAGGRSMEGRPALRVALGAVPQGSRLEGEILFDVPPAGWASDFLAPEDRVELEGRTLRLVLHGEGWPKGLLVLPPEGAAGQGGEGEDAGEGSAGEAAREESREESREEEGLPALAVAGLRFTLDGEPVPGERLAVGEGTWDGDAASPSELETAAWPPAAAVAEGTAGRAPRLFVWRPAAVPAAAAGAGATDETARRLRALGYIQ